MAETLAGAADFLATVARAELRSGSGDWAEAAALWAEVTAANPVNGDYWARLAEARFAAGQYETAAQAYEKVLELGVRSVFHLQYREDQPELMPGEVAYRIACCRAELGQREEAVEGLARALGRGFRDLGRARDEEAWKPLLTDPRVRDLLGIIDPGLARDEGWRADLRLLAREIKRRAYTPFAVISEDEFDRAVSRLDQEIPGLADAQILVGMMKLIRHLGDGHAFVLPPSENAELSGKLPVDLFWFPEGWFVIGAGPGHEQLLGARVDKIGRHAMDEVMAAFDPIIARDNDQQVTFAAGAQLRQAALLYGLGLTGDPARATLTVRLADGTSAEVTLTAEAFERRWDRYPPGWIALADTVPGRPRPLHLGHRELPYWFEYLSEADLVYFQYNAVRDHPAEPFAAFCDRLFGFILDRRPARLVIDLRWNGGGNTFLAQALLHRLIACPQINRRGALFVIIGRLTFSAAQNTATAIDRETAAIFVGEPTGSRPNFIGETAEFELPYSKLQANVADLYWQTSWPWDRRTWIAPDIYAPPTFAAFSRNEDPAMAAILSLGEHLPGR